MSKPPLTSTKHILPFDRLDALTFERLCLWLVRSQGYLRPEHYGLAGSEQGRDVIAYLQTKENEELWYFQCKRYKKVDSGILNREVDKIYQLSLNKPEFKPEGIVFVISCSISSNIRDEVKLFCVNRGFKCEFWALTELDMYVKENPDIVQEFFGIQDNEKTRIAIQRHQLIGAIDEDVLKEANKLFAEMPTHTIPLVSPLPTGSRVIYSHNPLFMGRENDLLEIAKALKQGQCAVINQVVATTGIGGIGKTQLASEFVHRYGKFFAGGVFWLNFSDPKIVPSEIALCGGAKHLDIDPNFYKLPLETQVDFVLAAWDSPLPRLLVFDNCEDEELFAKWKRVTGGCRTIITSRRTEWSLTLGVKVFPLKILGRDESVMLLRSYSPKLSTAEETVLSQIAEELGDLPLALHLAGSFLARYSSSISPSTYLSQLSRPDLLQHPSLQGRGQKHHASPTLHEQHIARTFALSYERLNTSDPIDILAIKILARAAYLAHGTPIPKYLLFAILDLDQEDDMEGYLQAEDAIYRLLELGLFEKESEYFLQLHRLLASFVREFVEDDSAQNDVELSILATISYWNSLGYPMLLTSIESHLRTVTEAVLPREDEVAARLSSAFGYYLFLNGDYLTAIEYLEKALECANKVEEIKSNTVNLIFNYLGVVSRVLGNLDAAKDFYQRALNALEQEDQQDKHAIASLLNNIGLLLQEQENNTEALEYYKRALVNFEEEQEKDKLAIAAVFNNIGLTLLDQNNFDEAKIYCEQALNIRKEILGEDHQLTALTTQNLGGIYSSQGNYELAKEYYQRALNVYRKVLREDHPDIARTLHNLADVHKYEGDFSIAKQYCKQALEIQKLNLGELHDATLAIIKNLAEIHQNKREFDEAYFYFSQLLSLHEQKYGNLHQSLSNDLISLGNLLSEKGEFTQAKNFYKRAVEINETLDEVDVLANAFAITRLAQINQSEGNYADAVYLFKRALESIEAEFGLHNIATALQLSFVAEALRSQGQLAESLSIPYYERAVEAFESIQPIHDDYSLLLNNFATVLKNQGLYARAQVIYEKSLNVIEQISGKQNYEYILVLNNLAVVHRQLNNYYTARSLLEEALSILKEQAKLPADYDELIGLTLHNLAILSFYEGDYQSAIILIQIAISIHEQVLGIYHPQTQITIASFYEFIRRINS